MTTFIMQLQLVEIKCEKADSNLGLIQTSGSDKEPKCEMKTTRQQMEKNSLKLLHSTLQWWYVIHVQSVNPCIGNSLKPNEALQLYDIYNCIMSLRIGTILNCHLRPELSTDLEKRWCLNVGQNKSRETNGSGCDQCCQSSRHYSTLLIILAHAHRTEVGQKEDTPVLTPQIQSKSL